MSDVLRKIGLAALVCILFHPHGYMSASCPGSLAAMVCGSLMGATGATGSVGPTGATGSGTAGASAEFVSTTIAGGVNQNISPGTPFTFGTTVMNVGTGIFSSIGEGGPGSGVGSLFTLVPPLGTLGIYAVNYGISVNNPGTMGIYTGTAAGSLVINTAAIAGGLDISNQWLRGGGLIQVTPGSALVIAISPYYGPDSVVALDGAGNTLSFVTIVQIM